MDPINAIFGFLDPYINKLGINKTYILAVVTILYGVLATQMTPNERFGFISAGVAALTLRHSVKKLDKTE